MKILFFILCLLFATPAFAEDTPGDKPASDEDVEVVKAVQKVASSVSNQIRPCWTIPDSGKPLSAEISIEPNGKITFVQFTDQVTPEQKELAKSIKDAIADPKCNPVKNVPPAEFFTLDQNLILLFAPKN